MASYRKVQLKNGVCFIAIPKNIVNAMGILPGDYILVHMNDNGTMILDHITADKVVKYKEISTNLTKYVPYGKQRQ